MKRFNPGRLYCFSPPVMIATFFLELLFAAYVLYRYRFDTMARLVMVLLVLLAVFQLAEYNVCEGAWGVDSLTWSRIGYAAITFLPAVGIHLLARIAGRPNSRMIAGIYLLAVVFGVYYLTAAWGLHASVCYGNYVIFEVNPHINTFYAVYYYGLELLALILAWRYGSKQKNSSRRQALYGLATGYGCLLVPTTTVNIINPETIRGIPSIMCGFAILLAIVVTWYVLPRIGKKR